MYLGTFGKRILDYFLWPVAVTQTGHGSIQFSGSSSTSDRKISVEGGL